MTSNHRALEDADVALIERVKMTPSLYDPRKKDFRLTYKKEQDWAQVSESLGLSVVDARRRWTCLRDRYSRELKQLRTHDDKGDYGKNDFFRLMDFLRRFVRKRKERSRLLPDSRMAATKIEHAHIEQPIEDDVDELEFVSDQNSYVEEIQPTYDNKMETTMEATETEEYHELVEVDASEDFEDYVEHQHAETSNCSSTATKSASSNNKGFMPIILPAAGSSTTTFTLTTQQQEQKMFHHQQQHPQHHQLSIAMPSHTNHEQKSPLQTQPVTESVAINENEDDFFCKSIAAYLRQLSRRHKIKAKVEMFQILEKYIELEENATEPSGVGKNVSKC